MKLSSLSEAKFEDFPKLVSWLNSDGGSQSQLGRIGGDYASSIAAILATDGLTPRLETWIRTLRRISSDAQSCPKNFFEGESLLRSLGINLVSCISDFAAIAIEYGLGNQYTPLVDVLADSTELISLRFLSAWMALNMQDLPKCISECEKVEDPYAALYTIHGQALLELGQVAEAEEILSIAVGLDPSDGLAQFQLAKASLVGGHYTAAWEAAKACWNISGHDPEAALMLAIIANEMTLSQHHAEDAWAAMSTFLTKDSTNEVIITNLLGLAFKSGRKEWALHVVNLVDWRRVFEGRGIYTHISRILRGFGDRNWLDLAAQVLQDFDGNRMPQAK